MTKSSQELSEVVKVCPDLAAECWSDKLPVNEICYQLRSAELLQVIV